jgi:Type ISP C-terminal specificity domain/N-6 DNA Methylase
MDPLESYLTRLREIRSSGQAQPETSYYDALANLLNEIGKSLKPKVRCNMQLKNLGGGMPDGGLYTEEQLKSARGQAKPLPQNPARGVIEVKATSDDAWITADGEQVSRYWAKYRQVLVTNYRDFVFVGQDLSGKAVKLETYRLADSETDFWNATEHPRRTADRHKAFAEFAKRAMLHAAPVTSPQDVAWFLASYARDALARIELHELPALASVRKALEEALGLTFEGEKGEHFFRSTLVQTLFYGVFSAWVLWSKQRKPQVKDRFDWWLTTQFIRVPVLRKLFHEVAEPGQMERLNLAEILDWAAAVLNRVDRPVFFAKFQEAHAVQYFYEPFLQAFDPELRKQLGVWYTPPEIVQYMVARVDTVLREELNLPDGLADKNVYVLDPCCGTGSYIVEVLKKIHETLNLRGEDAFLASDLKEAAKNRVFGFEILPAPFVVAHLQIGLLLQTLGAPLAEKGDERIGVYLTNALTGWEPPKEAKKRLLFPELEEERDHAEHVKRDTPILVILGNPPYNGFAGVSPEEEQGLVEPYKEGLVKEWKIKKFNLDDLYVRFFRLAERRITEKQTPGRGILCYISNFSYLSDPSYVVMRKRFTAEFDSIYIDCMNGDSRETGKLTPDGKPDPSVFSTESNPEGIRLGTAIGLMVRHENRNQSPVRFYREFWGTGKRSELLRSLGSRNVRADYKDFSPTAIDRFSFRPSATSASYRSWPRLIEFCAESPISGLQEMRRGALMSIAKTALEQRISEYLDPETSWDTLKQSASGLTIKAGRFDPHSARTKVLKSESYQARNVVRYALYPFDTRWAYHSNKRPLWNEPRPALAAQQWNGNSFFITRMFAERPNENVPAVITSVLPDYHLLRPNAVAIPIRLRPTREDDGHHGRIKAREDSPEGKTIANLGSSARAYLGELGINAIDDDASSAQLVWNSSLAIIYSPRYLHENGAGIRQDWPRVPLPDSKKALLASAELGQQVTSLLNTEHAVPQVTLGDVRAELKVIATISRAGGGSLKDEELELNAGWGRGGKDGIVMPGRGSLVERPYSTAEQKAIAEGAKALGLSEGVALANLGKKTCDVYLNGIAYWSNIPIGVWEYTIGGYQVVKKWLSYREQPILGRALTKDEVRYVQEMARRIAAILLLQPALDANYESVKQHTFLWPSAR